MSCSECSYDSESCTCVSADKCYCSLSRRIPEQPHVPPNTVVCSCDTDSCSESNKCYCARQTIRPTILEQLRQRGIMPYESTLSRAGSPDRGRVTKTGRGRTPSQGLDVLKVHYIKIKCVNVFKFLYGEIKIDFYLRFQKNSFGYFDSRKRK